MTVVVADTSPVNYLLLIGEITILPQLYGQVLIPLEVLAELSDVDAPPEVLKWVRSRPSWLHTRQVRTLSGDPQLGHLDPGERAAILLAQEEADTLLLIDDAAGRSEASRRGLQSTGTLGILRAAAIRELLNLPTSLNNLARTNFRFSQSLISELLTGDAARKRGSQWSQS